MDGINHCLIGGNKEEAYVEAAVVAAKAYGEDAVAARRPAKQRLEPPATAANHVAQPRCRAFRISLRLCGIITIPIATPLPYISVHIIQDTQLSVSYGGGTYTLEGNKYFETIDYHSQKNIEGYKNVLMTLEFINDTLTQTYHPFDENWLQIDSIINKERYVRLN